MAASGGIGADENSWIRGAVNVPERGSKRRTAASRLISLLRLTDAWLAGQRACGAENLPVEQNPPTLRRCRAGG